MKILIVDDEVEVKCGGIIKECNERGIKFEVVKTRRGAIVKLQRNNDFNGIILDMAFPISESSDLTDVKAGDRILRELQKRKYKIPVLVFSKIEVSEEYSNLFAQMKSWDKEEEKKLFAFFEKLQKEQPQ